jgi:hypothetical protein
MTLAKTQTQSQLYSCVRCRRMGNAAAPNGHLDTPSRPPNSLIKNNSSGEWVCQKYGGTSVGKFAINIAEAIIRFVPH